MDAFDRKLVANAAAVAGRSLAAELELGPMQWVGERGRQCHARQIGADFVVTTVPGGVRYVVEGVNGECLR